MVVIIIVILFFLRLFYIVNNIKFKIVKLKKFYLIFIFNKFKYLFKVIVLIIDKLKVEIK